MQDYLAGMMQIVLVKLSPSYISAQLVEQIVNLIRAILYQKGAAEASFGQMYLMNALINVGGSQLTPYIQQVGEVICYGISSEDVQIKRLACGLIGDLSSNAPDMVI